MVSKSTLNDCTTTLASHYCSMTQAFWSTTLCTNYSYQRGGLFMNSNGLAFSLESEAWVDKFSKVSSNEIGELESRNRRRFFKSKLQEHNNLVENNEGLKDSGCGTQVPPEVHRSNLFIGHFYGQRPVMPIHAQVGTVDQLHSHFVGFVGTPKYGFYLMRRQWMTNTWVK